MPEGPEVRKYADALEAVLSDRRIQSFEARTRGLWRRFLTNTYQVPQSRDRQKRRQGGALQGEVFRHIFKPHRGTQRLFDSAGVAVFGCSGVKSSPGLIN